MPYPTITLLIVYSDLNNLISFRALALLVFTIVTKFLLGPNIDPLHKSAGMWIAYSLTFTRPLAVNVLSWSYLMYLRRCTSFVLYGKSTSGANSYISTGLAGLSNSIFGLFKVHLQGERFAPSLYNFPFSTGSMSS